MLWPDQPDFNPVGELIHLNGRPFRVVGIFKYYERDEDKRRRELGIKPPGMAAGRGSRGGGSRGWGAFDRKNRTIIIPVTTMLYDFKSANVVGSQDHGPQSKLDGLYFQVADTDRMDQTLEQVGQILTTTHRGIRDFTFDTRQEWFAAIEQNIATPLKRGPYRESHSSSAVRYNHIMRAELPSGFVSRDPCAV